MFHIVNKLMFKNCWHFWECSGFAIENVKLNRHTTNTRTDDLNQYNFSLKNSSNTANSDLKKDVNTCYIYRIDI